eukprot:323816_1
MQIKHFMSVCWFEVGHGFDSCTDEVKSQQFIYESMKHARANRTVNHPLTYEVIDCPGFFDTDVVLSKAKESELFNDNIKKCIHLTKHGISAYLLLIPRDRMSAYHAASIRFIMEYFPYEAKKYVWLILTKSGQATKHDILNELANPQSRKQEASKLVQKFVIDIDQRLITTECVDVRNTVPYREQILQAVYQTHVDNDGPYAGNGIWNALKSQLAAYQKQQEEQMKQKQKIEILAKQNEAIIHDNRKKEIWMWTGTAIAVLIAAIVIGYGIRRYNDDTTKLTSELSRKSNQLSDTKSKLSDTKTKLSDTKTQLVVTKEKLDKSETYTETLKGTIKKLRKPSCFAGSNTFLLIELTINVCVRYNYVTYRSVIMFNRKVHDGQKYGSLINIMGITI